MKPSPPRKRGSRFSKTWVPACAGTTTRRLRRAPLTRFGVFHHELDALQAVELVHADAVGRKHARRQRPERVEAHRLEPAPVLDETQAQVALSHHALALDAKAVAEERRGKS